MDRFEVCAREALERKRTDRLSSLTRPTHAYIWRRKHGHGTAAAYDRWPPEVVACVHSRRKRCCLRGTRGPEPRGDPAASACRRLAGTAAPDRGRPSV